MCPDRLPLVIGYRQLLTVGVSDAEMLVNACRVAVLVLPRQMRLHRPMLRGRPEYVAIRCCRGTGNRCMRIVAVRHIRGWCSN